MRRNKKNEEQEGAIGSQREEDGQDIVEDDAGDDYGPEEDDGQMDTKS